MGSTSTFVRQCIVLIAAMGVLALLAPVEAKLWVGLAALIGIAFFVFVSVRRHREINRLAVEVDEVLHEGRQIDFSNCKEGDVAVLSNELSKMVANLTRTRDQLAHERNALANALADISHQIRTPLTAITLMFPLIEDASEADERKKLTRQLETMVERVSWLVTTLLKIAKVDAGAMHVERRIVKAESVVRNAIAPLEAAMDLRDVTLVIDTDRDASFQGDERWTAEAVENIVKNCMECTPAGGQVIITAQEDALATSIVISDTGSGIASKDLPHIFERFYRGERTDASEHSGFGIGLSLAQALISAQGGTLSASNNPNGGARFEIAFPKFVV